MNHPRLCACTLGTLAGFLGCVSAFESRAQITSIAPLTDIPVEEYRVSAEVWGALYQRITGVKSIHLTASGPGTDPVLAILWEFPGRREALRALTQTEWNALLQGIPVVASVPGPILSSDSDFQGAGDANAYDIRSAYVGYDPEGNLVCALLAGGPQNDPRVLVARPSSQATVVMAGDPVPRPFHPDFTGTNFAEFRAPTIVRTNVVIFPAAGQNFSGVYARPIEGGEIRVLAENFAVAGDEFGDIFNAVPAPDGTNVLFTARTGIYAVAPDGSQPVRLLTAGGEYSPGKVWNQPGSIDAESTTIVFEAYDQDFRPGVFQVRNFAAPSHEWTVTLVAGAGTPVPGGSGKLAGAQRPIVFGDLTIFEGFGPTGFLGTFGARDGTVFPVLRRGDLLDGKPVSIGVYYQGSLLGNQLGLSVQFQDLTSAPYLVTFGDPPALARFLPGTADYSPTGGFTATITGEPGRAYQLEFADPTEPFRIVPSNVSWSAVGPPAPLVNPEQRVHDPGAAGQPGRLYRLRSAP